MDLSDWLTLTEAAQVLECSEKTINRYVSAGQIQKSYRRVPGRRKLPVLNPADVERIKKETVVTKPFVLSLDHSLPASQPATASRGALTRRPDNPLAVLQQLLNHAPSAPSLDKKFFLTIDEAHELVGLPKSVILELARAGKIPAMKRGSWFIWREGLRDKLADLVSLDMGERVPTAQGAK